MTCSRSNRLVRGSIGAVAGGVAGAAIGYGVVVALTLKPRAGLPATPFMFSILSLLGAGTGATIGAWKPQCSLVARR